MSKITRFLGALAVACVMLAPAGIVVGSLGASRPAHAQAASAAPEVTVTAPASTTVTAAPKIAVPYGDWITAFLTWASDIAIAGLSLAVGRYVPSAVGQYLTNQVLGHAVDYAFAAIEGAVRGRTLDVSVAKSVVGAAEAYVIENAPALATRLGATLKPKIIARVSGTGVLPASSTAIQLGA